MRRMTIGAGLVMLGLACGTLAQQPTMDPMSGRFHAKHTQQIGLQCTNCHAAEQADTLYLRAGERQGIGPVDRNQCLACHKAPASPTWYGKSGG